MLVQRKLLVPEVENQWQVPGLGLRGPVQGARGEHPGAVLSGGSVRRPEASWSQRWECPWLPLVPSVAGLQAWSRSEVPRHGARVHGGG